MCGRIALYTPPRALARLLDAALAAGLDAEATPSWNLGPTRTLFGVADDHGSRVLDAYRWGLVPWWAKDPGGSNTTFNARAETVATKPSFRDAFKSQRLLIPVDGFFEWDRRGASKVPHFFTRAGGGPVVLAGLFDRWRDPSTPGSPPLVTCTVLTTTPGPDIDGIHNRMPVVIEPDAYDLWLTASDDELDAVQALCAPSAAGTLVHHPVDARVGNVRNDGPELIATAASA
jgi:putative SOS response-associated peptidase YedK